MVGPIKHMQLHVRTYWSAVSGSINNEPYSTPTILSFLSFLSFIPSLTHIYRSAVSGSINNELYSTPLSSHSSHSSLSFPLSL